MRDGEGRRGWLAVVALLAAVGLAGCGGDDDDAAAVGGGDAQVSGEGEGGGDNVDESGSSGGESADADIGDFPIPAPDGLVLDALADSGIPLGGQRQLYYEEGDFDRVVAFYDDWTSKNGEWSTAQSEGTYVYLRLDGDGLQQISVSPGHDPGAQADGPVTFVLLVAGE